MAQDPTELFGVRGDERPRSAIWAMPLGERLAFLAARGGEPEPNDLCLSDRIDEYARGYLHFVNAGPQAAKPPSHRKSSQRPSPLRSRRRS